MIAMRMATAYENQLQNSPCCTNVFVTDYTVQPHENKEWKQNWFQCMGSRPYYLRSGLAGCTV